VLTYAVRTALLCSSGPESSKLGALGPVHGRSAPVVGRLDARSRAQLEALPVERTKRVEVSMIESQDPVGAVAVFTAPDEALP
jgi:hypothetical protein